MSAEVYVWKVTTPSGDSCHFGGEVDALAYARSTGTVERIRLVPRDLTIVRTDTGSASAREAPRSPAQPDACELLRKAKDVIVTEFGHDMPEISELLDGIDAFLRGGSGG